MSPDNIGKKRLGFFFLICLFLCAYIQIVFDLGNCQDEKGQIDHALRVSGNESIEYENEYIEIKGDIAVKDNASLRFLNCNVTVLWVVGGDSPNIQVSDRGRLSLENSSIMIRVDLIPNYSTDGRIIIEDHAVLNVVDSKIMCTSNVWMSIRDESYASFTGSEYYGLAPKSGLHRCLEDKLPKWLLEEYREHFRVSLEVNATAIFRDSRIGSLGCYNDTNCTILDSEIDQLYPYSSIETKVKDTWIDILSASVSNSQFSYTGKAEGLYSDWSSREYFGSEISTNVRLEDSWVDHLWLSLNNCTSVISDAELWIISVHQGELTVTDSEVWIMNLFYNDAAVLHSNVDYLVGECHDGELVIEDCDIHWLGLTGHNREKEYDMVYARVADSEIDSCNLNYWWITEEVELGFDNVRMGNLTMIPAPKFTVDFKDCTVEGLWKVYPQRKYEDIIQMRGNMDFIGTEIEKRHNLILTREYEVMVIDEDQPVWGAVVELIKREKIWKTGVTGMDGMVNFNVTWVQFGEDQSWIPPDDLASFVNITETVGVMVEGEEQPKVISIMSDTPVILTTNKTPDYIITIAVALGIILCISAIFIYRSISNKRKTVR